MKATFLISDIRALWRSAWAPACPNARNEKT